MAIREERKLEISYSDGDGARSARTIWPIAIAYHSEAIVIAAWCELKQAIRHFRPDRIGRCHVRDDCFGGLCDGLRQD